MEEYGPLAKRKDDKRNCHEEVAVPDRNGPNHQKSRRRADGTVASELSKRVQSLRNKGELMNHEPATGLATHLAVYRCIDIEDKEHRDDGEEHDPFAEKVELD